MARRKPEPEDTPPEASDEASVEPTAEVDPDSACVVGMPIQVRVGSETDAGLVHSLQSGTISATIFRHGAIIVQRNLKYSKLHENGTWRHIQDAI